MSAGVLLGTETRTEVILDVREDTSSNFVALTGTLGYRYQRVRGGPVFRLGFTPLLGFGDGDGAGPDEGLLPWAGISFGWAF